VHALDQLVALDGVFSKADDGEIEFHEACDLTPDHVGGVSPPATCFSRPLASASGARRRHGLLDEVDATGMPGTRRRRVGQGSGGPSVDASVRIEGVERAEGRAGTVADETLATFRPLRPGSPLPHSHCLINSLTTVIQHVIFCYRS
jgi:hypothetical protein